ncbi:MAG TPA: hypothetical protein VIS51_05075 [Solirubrobacterales bacterium]
MAEPDPKHTGWRKLLLENLWVVIIGPIVVGLAIAGISGAFKGLTSEKPGPEIEALESVVRNGASEHEIIDVPNSDFIGSRQTGRSRARVEVRLRNTGERRTVITDAVVTIRKLIAVPPCGVGGGIEVSNTYDVVLPRHAAEGDSVEFPINQQIAPDGVDRFVFTVGHSRDAGEVVYQLDLAVRHDNAKEPSEVGRVLIALPGAPTTYRLYLDSRQGCGQEVIDSLREAAELEGVRSPQLERALTAVDQAP